MNTPMDVERLEAWQLPTFGDAVAEADRLTRLSGDTFLPVDRGSYVSPRFDVIAAPRVGDKVSKGFNGDYYPVGMIVKISDSFRVVTAQEPSGHRTRFYRRGETASWIQEGGTWSMVHGTIDQRNPHF